MFEDWPDNFDPPSYMEVDPPSPVTVDLAAAIPTAARVFRRDQLPLRIKSGGLDLTGRIPGLLHAWARSADGTWIGLVEFVVSTGNKRGRLKMRQWCPRRALEQQE